MLAGSLMLGGLLPLSHHARDHWGPSGAWRLPVGDAYHLIEERPLTPGPFFLLRGVEWDGGRASHQGADIGNGRSGGFVRAAAAGLVVRVADHGDHGGYGTHVVLAHRLPGGVLAYSVYAHLRLASARVRPGQFVPAGTTLGRIGMTGRTTTPHLHFEVRTSADPGERWELANVEDPLAFVEERLPSHRADTTGTAAYLEWAEYAALLSTDAQADEALSREHWWRMLAVAGQGTLVDPALPAVELRDALIADGILPSTASSRWAGDGVDWSELALDLNRLRQDGPRGGHAPFRRARHRSLCESHFGSPTPGKRTSELSARDGRPSLTDAVLLIADLAGPAPEPPKKRAPVAKKTTGGTRADSLARAKRAAPPGSRTDSAAGTRKPPATSDTTAKKKLVPAKVDSVPVARKSASGASGGLTARKSSTKPESAGATAKKTAAKPAVTTTTPKSASKSAGRFDSLAKSPKGSAKPDSVAKPKPASARPDTAKQAAKPAAKPAKKPTSSGGSATVKSTPTRTDSAKKPAARAPADTAARRATAKSSTDSAAKAAKPKTAPPKPAPSRPDSASS